MVEMARPKQVEGSDTAGTGASNNQVAEPKVEYISTRKISVSFDKAWLASDTDVDEYLQKLREALLKEINEGKRIQI